MNSVFQMMNFVFKMSGRVVWSFSEGKWWPAQVSFCYDFLLAVFILISYWQVVGGTDLHAADLFTRLLEGILNDEFCINYNELCFKNDEFCINYDEFCIKNDELCINFDEFWLPEGLLQPLCCEGANIYHSCCSICVVPFVFIPLSCCWCSIDVAN